MAYQQPVGASRRAALIVRLPRARARFQSRLGRSIIDNDRSIGCSFRRGVGYTDTQQCDTWSEGAWIGVLRLHYWKSKQSARVPRTNMRVTCVQPICDYLPSELRQLSLGIVIGTCDVKYVTAPVGRAELQAYALRSMK